MALLISYISGSTIFTYGYNAWTGDGSPDDVELGEGWTSIGDSAFKQTSITSIIIPKSVTSIGSEAFNKCYSLETVTFAADSELTIIGQEAFDSTPILSSIVLPASVLEIGHNAFSYATGLTAIIIPDSVTTIGESAFRSTTISSIAIPASVTTILNSAFENTTNLTTVTFAADSQLTTIGTWGSIFASSGLTTFTAPLSPVLNLFGVSVGPNQTVSGKSGVTVNTPAPPAPPAPICFPAGTPVLTDQGEVDIDKIDPEKHTINANKIEGITETTGIEDYMIMIKKHAFSEYVPCRDTLISANHKIMFGDGSVIATGAYGALFNGRMVQAREFLDKKEFADKIYKVDYTGYPLYNVLLENVHCVMVVNNLVAETLSPTSVNAWLFRKMKSNLSNVERKAAMDAYMQRVFPAPVLSCIMIGCK
jgi:hypothetical protein